MRKSRLISKCKVKVKGTYTNFEGTSEEVEGDQTRKKYDLYRKEITNVVIKQVRYSKKSTDIILKTKLWHE